jgi:hypothetical protein
MTHRPLLFVLTSAVVAVLALGSEACKTGNRGARLPGIFTASTSQAVVGPEAILGRWKSKDETLDVQAGGTVLINGQSFTYTRDGWVLTIQGPQSSVTYPFQIQGDTMTVTINGGPVVYTRVKSESAPAPGATGMLPPPAPSASASPSPSASTTPTPAPGATGMLPSPAPSASASATPTPAPTPASGASKTLAPAGASTPPH